MKGFKSSVETGNFNIRVCSLIQPIAAWAVISKICLRIKSKPVLGLEYYPRFFFYVSLAYKVHNITVLEKTVLSSSSSIINFILRDNVAFCALGNLKLPFSEQI